MKTNFVIPEVTLKEFGKLLKQQRINADLSQAEAADVAQTTQSTWSKWERGETMPGALGVLRFWLAIGLNVPAFTAKDAGEQTKQTTEKKTAKSSLLLKVNHHRSPA